MGRYTILDSIAVADCALDIEGESLPDLFECAARAVAELMVDPATVAATVKRRISLAAPSLDLLLYDWMSELIFLKDSEQLVFPQASVGIETGVPCQLEARLLGGPIDPPRTALRADAKAVTLHQFSLQQRDGGWHARVIIDI